MASTVVVAAVVAATVVGAVIVGAAVVGFVVSLCGYVIVVEVVGPEVDDLV